MCLCAFAPLSLLSMIKHKFPGIENRPYYILEGHIAVTIIFKILHDSFFFDHAVHGGLAAVQFGQPARRRAQDGLLRSCPRLVGLPDFGSIWSWFCLGHSRWNASGAEEPPEKTQSEI